MSEDVVTTGWDAIEEQMVNIYGAQEPKHYGTVTSYALGGHDPLDGISVYKAEQPFPHWHFVTFGFSELYEKESEDTDYSGFGFELTFRLTREEHEEEPPAWALNLLQNMGRYVFSSGNVLAAGDYLDANGPICLESDTKLTALVFIEDTELPAIHTPNGRVEFVQMIGMTEEELEATKTWNTIKMLEACQEMMPGYITNLSRDSMLQVPVIAEAVQCGIERDGSNTGFLFVDQLSWEPGKNRLLTKTPAVLTLGAKQAGTVAKLIRGRLLKGKELTLSSQDLRVILAPGEETRCESGEKEVRLTLDTAAAAELSQIMQPQESVLKLSTYKGLTIQVVKTYIRDQDGQVVSTIG
ncbi:suppressor of fused domain protein [Paenibacillus sp. UMB4589-SE434]|uniref:suppressor of fused domain protein n=1 Tax=Paenibacillus sp. UMB4589-SE434 TaxID=3046314 RepID=UPI00254ADEE6|nr:suppressor of fused domain protein [Paenibacillus sp. UMB4589-SE434]MDK8180255.1 suppressor of fused domain protein [Paenibacillus sp. UMB4589-SE434]